MKLVKHYPTDREETTLCSFQNRIFLNIWIVEELRKIDETRTEKGYRVISQFERPFNAYIFHNWKKF